MTKTAAWIITQGQKVESKGLKFEVVQILDLRSVLGKDLSTGKYEKLDITEISQIDEAFPETSDTIKSGLVERQTDLSTVPQEKWEIAVRRAESVRRLLDLTKLTREAVDKEAELLGVSRATMYRYLDKYLATGKTSALIPTASDGGRGKTRTDETVESVLALTINEFYLTKQNPRVQKVIREFKRRCFNAGIKAPHDNTVRNRIKALVESESVKKRQGVSAARRFMPAPGEFPEGRFPLEVVQIDHTPVDLQFVDDITRKPIGRLYLTVAIDVYSRMILGFYLSPDNPSITPLGMCLSHAILPKETELSRLGVEGEWSCWGLMSKIHADNAGEFRGYTLQRACHEYGIDIEWRPVGRPHYGAHIERLLGTFMQEVHLLPGTTFSNVQKKGEYDSEKEAVFTYDEFEKWLTTYIVGVYHKTKHEGIGMTPETKFERGIFVGDDDFGPVGFPPRITDERKLRIDFMPSIERTVQQFGVEIDIVRYYDAVLNPFIGARDPKNQRLTRKFIFKRNPRNLQKIYFYHPDLRQYFEIPYRNLANPTITLWELKAARRRLQDEGENVKTEEQIFSALNRMKEIQDRAQEATKKMRRDDQRKRIYDQQSSQHGLGDPSRPLGNEPEIPRSSVSGLKNAWADFLAVPADEIIPLEIDES